MRSVRLGRTGLHVSQGCLGTMTFGLQCDEVTSFAIMSRAAAGGISFFDTADGYPLGGVSTTVGRTEEIVGKWVEKRRHEFVIATKVFSRMGSSPWDVGLSRKHIMDAVDQSLRRLRTDYVDLYQIHHPDSNSPVDETLRAMDDIVRAGKARYIGVSNWSAWRTARALGQSEANGWDKFVCIQPRYNLLYRAPERDLFELCEYDGLGVLPYNPLAAGLLTGKHAGANAPTGGSRFTLGTSAKNYQSRYWQAREFEAVEAIQPRTGS